MVAEDKKGVTFQSLKNLNYIFGTSLSYQICSNIFQKEEATSSFEQVEAIVPNLMFGP